MIGVLLLLFYNLYEGNLMQNARGSVEALGWCASAGLHLDPALLPDGYVSGQAEQQGTAVKTGRLFWLTFILNIQV